MKHFLMITGLTLTFFAGALIGQVAGIDPIVSGTVLTGITTVKFFIPGRLVEGLTFNAFDLSGITGYADEHKKELIATLVNGLDIAEDIQVQPNVKNKMKLPKLTVGDGFRPFSSTTEFGNGGDLVISERELVTQTGKREILIDIRVFKDKYLAWRTGPGNGAGKKFDDYDFAKFVWAQVIKGLQREINDETSYFGFDKSTAVAYSEASTYANKAIVTFTYNGRIEYFQNISGSATTAGQDPLDTPVKWRKVTARAVVPGIESYILAAIAGGFGATSTGSITDGVTAVPAFKKIFRDMPVPYQKQGVIVHASYTDRNFLLDGIETNLSKYTTPEVSDLIKNGLVPIPGTDYKGWVKAATWMGGSRRLIAQPMQEGTTKGENIFMGTDLLSDANEINNKPNLWTMESGIAVDLGFQIADLNALRVGDQA